MLVCLRVSAGVILTHCAELKVLHLGENDDFLRAVDVDPGESSGDTSDGPAGRTNQSDRGAIGPACATRCGAVCMSRRHRAVAHAFKLDDYKDYLLE